MKIRLLAGFSCWLLFAANLQAENRSLHAARESITRSELQSHVGVLADDTFEGRESGARGGHAAGGYLVKLLQDLQLQGAGDRGSYYQTFDNASRNILALQEGSDPRLKHEVIVVSGHYDHVGYGTRRNSYGPWGYIHNGADDNASGVASLLEIAQAMQKLPEAPRRTILFAFWDAEEKGLLGSKHWLRKPTLELARIKCMVNVDMIGRLTNDRVELYGTRTAPGLRRLVSNANSQGLDLDFTWKMKEDSDHWPFFMQGIPVLMFHTGLHGDYHRPSDDAERINHEGLERITQVLFETLLTLANDDELPKFRVESRRETDEVRRVLELPSAVPPARLGITWRKGTAESGVQLQVLTVTRGSAAEIAGIRVGDIIHRVNGAAIDDDFTFRQQVLAAPVPLSLAVQSASESIRTVEVKLTGEPIRVGITAREDAGEPGVVLVTHVVFGSAAAAANLRVADRIHAVNGKSFANQTEFNELLDAANETLRLRVERRGRINEVELKLLD